MVTTAKILKQIVATADRAAALEKALELATEIIMKNEPGDSRAVSNEAVALAAVVSGDTSEPVMAVINKALRDLRTA